MICNVCDNENGFSEEEDGHLYCKLCCSRVEGINEDLVEDVESDIADLITVASKIAPSPSSSEEGVLMEEYKSDDDFEEILEKQDESKMVVPSRSAILDMLPADLRMRLKKEVTMTITTEYARMCLDDERFKLVLETKPVSFLRLSDCSGEISLFWRTGGLRASYILSNTSRETLRVATGFIRDQKEHGIGWVYTSTDLVSASRVLQGCDKEFTPLCAHYLSQHADPTTVRNPLVHKEEGHCCHGGSVEHALSYIQKHGVPKEKPKCKILDCFEHEELFFVKDIFRYHTIKQALLRLQTHPVAATLMLYEGWDDWNLIYRGPMKKGAKLLPPLEVLIIDCIKIDGEMVAVCKSIYGRDMGYGGNIYVSLEVMFITAGATRKAGEKNMCFIEPQHLLFNFYSVNVEETGPYSPRMREDPIQVEHNSFFKMDSSTPDQAEAEDVRSPENASATANKRIKSGSKRKERERERERELEYPASLTYQDRVGAPTARDKGKKKQLISALMGRQKKQLISALLGRHKNKVYNRGNAHVAQENFESSIAYLGLASLTATSPAEAYPIGNIIKEQDWDSLQDIYWLLLKEDGPASDFDAYPLFVRNRLNKLRDIKDETEKQMVCCILSFLTHLVMYKDFDLDKLIISTPAKNHLFPSTIYRKCKGLFKDKIKSHNMNRLICYVLLLTLHVDKFKTNSQDIAKDLRMSSTLHLDKYFNNLGCKFVREDSVVLATLPVPLQFPEIVTW